MGSTGSMAPPARRMAGIMILLTLSLGVAGCSGDDATGKAGEKKISPRVALTASDDWLQGLERFFFPDSYWSNKVALLDGEAQSIQATFRQTNAAYRKLLTAQRLEIREEMAKANAERRDARKARRQVINKYRTQVKNLRDKSRALGHELHEKVRARTLAAQILSEETR